MKKSTLLPILGFLGPLIMFCAFLYVSIFIGNVRQEDNLIIPLYLVPAGLAFLIWPVIYFYMLYVGIYQLRSEVKSDSRFQQAAPLLLINGMANALWFYADYTQNNSLVILTFLVMLGTLIKLNNLFELGKTSPNPKEFWRIKVPFSLYFGWITIAFPVGVTLWLIADFQFTGGSYHGNMWWASSILLVAGTIIGSLYTFKAVSSIFLGTTIWGLFWIGVNNVNSNPSITYTAWALAVLLLLLIIGRDRFPRLFRLRHTVS